MEFKDTLKQLRRERGLTQRELAEKTGLSLHTINSYESGRRAPNSAALVKLEHYFKVSGDYLMGRTAEERFDGTWTAIQGQWDELFAGLEDMQAELQALPPEERLRALTALNRLLRAFRGELKRGGDLSCLGK